MKITKAIICAAGFGTRFLPATKVVPKEMLPLIDRPIVQFLVEEAVASGIKEVILVVRPGTRMIEDHFGSGFLLENHLKNQGKKELFKELKKIGKMAKISVCYQDEKLPYGTGAPLASVANKIKQGEYFVLMFGDDLVKAKVPATKQLINFWEKNKKALILGCQEVPEDQLYRYGVVGFKNGSRRVDRFVEKPKNGEAPSNMCSFGRFILNRELVDLLLENKSHFAKASAFAKATAGKEFCLTDTIAQYAQGKEVLATCVSGKWLTTGDPLNWLKTTIEFALENKALKKDFATYLTGLIKTIS